MAILDIQIVSASLDRDPGRARRELQRDHLGADGLSDRRGGHDPAVGLSVARARHADSVRRIGRGLHGGEPDVRPLHLDQRDDRVARHPGLHRRRHDPHRVRHGLHHLPAEPHGADRADDRARRDARPHHRPHGRRLSHRHALLALAVLHQHRARHLRHRHRAHSDRFRQAGLSLFDRLRLARAPVHGGLSRRARICARGRPAQRLVRRRQRAAARLGVGHLGDRLLRPRADWRRAPIVDLRAFRDRNFALGSPVLLRARHRSLRPHLSLPALSRRDPRLRRAHDRRDHVRLGRRHVPDGADRRPPHDQGRSALHADRRAS